ncbi:MAG: 5-oxoprolinase subunit PxpB [Anaerolineaceae bacterium]|nr:5-oxoprolinase subunit PxpB [Anaerolineaceae bacterium]
MTESKYPYFKPAGDSAVLMVMGEHIDLEVNRRVHALDELVLQEHLDGIVETVPAYTSLLIYYDLLQLDYWQVVDWVSLKFSQVGIPGAEQARVTKIPTVYGGDDGPDLEYVAGYNQLSVEDVVEIHSSRNYPVFMMGFTPGFPYLGGMDLAIATPRLETPRTHVLAGSVGIAGEQTGVYPIDSPGGWQIIGRTYLSLFDPEREKPFLLSPGDQVRFVPISK